MRTLSILIVIMITLASIGCTTAPDTQQERKDLVAASLRTLHNFRVSNYSYYEVYIRTHVGMAIFPSIGKGGNFLGGAYGEGIVYDGSRIVGYCKIEQDTVGFPRGGQAYSQIIFFENKEAIEAFKRGEIGGLASASAAAIESGAPGQVDYDNGVAVFFLDSEVVMYKATGGGQKFSYQPKDVVD